MTSSDGETNQGGTLFKGGHYFPSPFFHMGKLIKGGNHGLRTPNDCKNKKNLKNFRPCSAEPYILLKDKMHKEYDEWMLNGPKTYTKANNIRAPTKDEVVDMLVKCWNEIPETLIKKSFVVSDRNWLCK